MTGHPGTHRYPIGDLIAAMGCSNREAQRRLNVSGSTFKEYRDRGMTERVADRLAVKAGLHPSDVWPSWYADQAVAVSRPCASKGCEERFVPARAFQRYCSTQCNRREANRRYRARDDVRDRRKEWDAEYRAEVRDYRNKQRRAYYQANREREIERQRAYDRARSSPHPRQGVAPVVMGDVGHESPGSGTNDPQPTSWTMTA